jgi:hypothetical protein
MPGGLDMSHRPPILVLVVAASLLSGLGLSAHAGVPKVVFGEDFTATG